MANSNDSVSMAPADTNATAADIARYNLGSVDALHVPHAADVPRTKRELLVDAATSLAHFKADRFTTRAKVIFSIVVLVELVFLSLGITGAAGQNYAYSGAYATYDPLQVIAVLGEYLYNWIGPLTNQWAAHDNVWIQQNVPGYWAVGHRAGVVGITLICAVLLAVSGALYQNVFKNPIAGPGMLGAGSGVSLGMMLLVALYGSAAPGMMGERYLYCYSLGAAILVFVIVAGKHLSGKKQAFDIVTMLLVGSILSQLLGFITMYMTLFVMDEADYLTFYNLSQMLVVDTSAISWMALGVATVVSLVPVWLLRFKFNALAFDEEEVRMMGLNGTALRGVALVAGAIMILAAQIHTGMVSMVSLIAPFIARAWFGCEFRKQFAGCVCVGCILLLACRDIVDLIPFVGDGIALGSVVSVFAMPLFVAIMAKHMRGWE